MQQEYEIRFPVVTDGILRLLLLFSLAYAAEMLAVLAAGADPSLLILSVGQNFQPLSLITHFFVSGSAGFSGLMQLFFSLLIIWSFGSELDQLWGTRNFYSYFFASQLAASLFTVGLGVVLGIPFVAAGIGAGLSALMLAYAVLWPNRQALFFFVIPMRMKWIVFIFFVLLLVGSWSWNHIVLHLSGVVFGGFLLFLKARTGRLYRAEVGGPYSYSTRSSSQQQWASMQTSRKGLVEGVKDKVEEWKKRRRLERKRREIDRRIEMKDEVDRLLEKISKDGMNSLSRKEKAFLDRASREL